MQTTDEQIQELSLQHSEIAARLDAAMDRELAARKEAFQAAVSSDPISAAKALSAYITAQALSRAANDEEFHILIALDKARGRY